MAAAFDAEVGFRPGRPRIPATDASPPGGRRWRRPESQDEGEKVAAMP